LHFLAITLFAGTAAADDTVASREFSGRSKHVTTGGVSVVKTSSGYKVVLAENFSLDGGPDPKIGFGAAGKFDASTMSSPLKNLTGKQSYEVPASVKVSKYDEIYIWCEKFNVPLGVALIK
jgi:hypothetical protein